MVDVLIVAKKLAAQVVYALIGMPEQDWDRLQGWTDAIHERLPFSFDDMSEFLAMVVYLDRVIAEQMALPEPDTRTILGGLSGYAVDGGLTAVDVRIHCPGRPTRGRPGRRDQADPARSNRSRFMTLFHAATKSRTNFSCASSLP